MGTAPKGFIKVEVYIKEGSQLQYDLDEYREPRRQKYGPAALTILADWSDNRHRPQQWVMGGAISSSLSNEQAQREEEEQQRKEEEQRQRTQKNVKKSTKAMKWG